MKQRFEHGLLKYLASLSVALGAGLIDPSAELMRLPEQLLERVADEAAEVDEPTEDRKRMLHLLACDPRPAVRARIAARADSLWPAAADEAQALLQRLANDADDAVRAAAARGLERLLGRATPVDRVELVASWATSDDAGQRAAIAAALRGATPLFLTDLAIEQLASDHDPEVRRHALAAAERHYAENPRVYARVLTGLASDPLEPIRRGASRALRHVRSV